MAADDRTFPTSELEQHVHSVTKNFKTKSRKLPKDFNLQRDCELFEMVQYRCSTTKELHQQALDNPGATPAIDCYPFARLFRRWVSTVLAVPQLGLLLTVSRCGQGASAFNVETTSWEGELAREPTRLLQEEVKPQKKGWSSIWSK
jgi:hypothetical protein